LTVKDRLIVALDVTTIDQARQLVSELKADVGMFKVGSQLFTLAGPKLVEEIIASGNKVFLDLKFHDIPHQVAGAARVAAELGVSLFTIHASGGTEMMRRAVEAVSETAERKNIGPVKVVAVSVLTSMDDNSLNEIGVT
jgi:orotidine-5'-phosphate decarboxylase